MNLLLDQLILLIGCFLFSLFFDSPLSTFHVLSLLLVLICFSICSYVNLDMLPLRSLKKLALCTEATSLCLLFIGSLSFPPLAFYLPLIVYQLFYENDWYLWGTVMFLGIVTNSSKGYLYLLFYVMLILLACYLKYKTRKLSDLVKRYKLLRDSSMEHNLLLQEKNRELIKEQDYEIHVATLKERTRIARDIHDNVGHLLSRCLLLAGALLAINQDEKLKEPLVSMKDTLTSAMNSIRTSVHDLRDDALNLEAALTTMLKDYKNHEVTFTYDLEGPPPNAIKYCFMGIAKEALANIQKHSNGTKITMIVREHPNFYQLIIADNGVVASVNEDGMGLSNMKERAGALKGHLSIQTTNGFRIFVTIPKQKGESKK